MVRKVACADLNVQYGQGCLLECELSPVAMTFRSQAQTHSKSWGAFKRVKRDFKLAKVSGAWQMANNMVFLPPLREELRWRLEFLDAVVRVIVTLRNDWP